MEIKKNNTTKKWLIGCGIGCGVVIILVVFLVVGGVIFVKNMVNSFEESEDILNDLTEKYGEIEDYCPSPSGFIESGRMEAFIKIRELVKPLADELKKSIDFLSAEGDRRKGENKREKESAGIFKKIREGVGLFPKIAEFLKKRNQVLLEVGMGIGEYYYIYTMAYYCWLDKPLTDGLPININKDSDFDYQYWEDEETIEIRQDLAVRRLHNMILPMLKNQYSSLLEKSDLDISEDWKNALEREIKLMEKNRYRLVWQDGLPEEIQASLEPYRDCLESGYISSINSIEFMIEPK
jgi:hypothetical protein